MSPRSLPVRLAAVVAAGVLVGVPAAHGQARDPTPLYAYYYIWFNASSWNRAKTDYPLLGRYTSDEQTIMSQHIRLAKQAGIDGFIVSWKSTPVLDARLRKLEAVAQRERFKLAVIYQGLDYERRPLPVEKVASDFDLFIREYGGSVVFSGFGKPVMIWSGTWEFTPKEVERVASTSRGKLKILASERTPGDYEQKASSFDGDAYYWSSVNPETFPDYAAKLQEMSRAVHAHGGLWFAPAAPGFDARHLGGKTVVERKDGDTLRRELETAQSSEPDAVGLISWNEFSENSHVEPSQKYGTSALETLADVRNTRFDAKGELDSSQPSAQGQGPGAIPVLVGFVLLLAASVFLYRRGSTRGRSRADPRAHRPTDPGS